MSHAVLMRWRYFPDSSWSCITVISKTSDDGMPALASCRFRDIVYPSRGVGITSVRPTIRLNCFDHEGFTDHGSFVEAGSSRDWH